MANLSNINNKFIVQDNSRVLVNKTSDTGATLQVGGSLSTDTSVRVGNGVLYVGDGSSATARIMGFGDTEMITGVSGATYLRVSGTSTLAGTLQAGQYILASGLAYGAVNSYTQIINGSTGAITGTTSNFVSPVAGTTVVSAEGAYAANGNVKLYEAKRSGGAVGGDWSYNDATTDMSLGTNTNHDFNLKTDNTTAITISNSQEVGINNTSPTSKLNVNGNDNGSAEFSVTLGSTTTAGGTANNASSTPVNKTLLTGYSIPYSGQTNSRLTTCGFLEFASTAGWTGSQRTWAITSGYDIGGQDSGAGGNKMAIILGNAQNVSPQIGTNGAIGESGDGDGANSLVACYWDNSLNMRLANSSRLYTGGGGSAAVPMITPGTDKNTGIWYPTSDTWAISTAGEERLRITSGGDIYGQGEANCIGMAQSDGDYLAKLEILNSDGFLKLYTGQGTPLEKVRISSYGDSFLVPANSGKLGIGTSSPGRKLTVTGDVSGDANNLLIANENDTNGDSASIGFSMLSNNTYVKSGIFFERTTNQGRGSLHLAVNNEVNGNNVTKSDAKLTINNTGNVGIGTTSLNYNLEIGGAANPVVAIVSNINSATSSLYFGDSDAKDRGQVRYTHFGDFMELKAGGATRVYIESGINTAYTADGLFNSNATPSYWNHGNGQFKLGYMDNGSGLYSGAYCFNVKSTDGIPVTGREIGAIYVRDTSNNRMPLIISNQGRININQTNTSTSFGSSTGWLTIANGTGAYNFYNYYTGTDGGSGCARYRLDNTSPSFFDFYYQTTQVGYITTNGTDIFYTNTSDYRLKEDLKSFDGMSLLEQIQVYDFKWKESDNRMYGVVAHELQDVVPQAVVGNKDEEKLQAVDYSKLVPILIKSIQELKAEIELLKNN